MTKLTPSMRLKMKRDTFFLPDQNNGVYFRNNFNSFRMEGTSVDKWVEKLIPMLNGEYTLEELTEGLPAPYLKRVYEIAEVLYRNGYVKDVSQDRPHQLGEPVLKKYDSQIEFLDSFSNSGAYRFQLYRQAKVLAIGSGPFFVSLVSALIESGLPKFNMLITDSVPTNRLRIEELLVHASKTDREVTAREITMKKMGENSWTKIVQPFDAILYVSQKGELEELRALNRVCKEEKKMFLPALFIEQVGLAGPLVHPDSEGCWESAWRRIHQSVLNKEQKLHNFSSTAAAMLANVIVFELFKKITGVSEMEQRDQFFLLELETLEGYWYSFLPHPLVTEREAAKWVHDFDHRLKQGSNKEEQSELLLYFSQLTSKQSGIFYIWEEGDLHQLPLAQCQVQVVDPLSEGPAELLPNIVCTSLTYEEARREAGLTGIEVYMSRMVSLFIKKQPASQLFEGSKVEIQDFVGIGTGETFAESVCRGLEKCLLEELKICKADQKYSISLVQLNAVEDNDCQFYLEALTTINGAPKIGLGEKVFGFPVVWVGTNGRWYGSVGLNLTLALQKALQLALKETQNEEAGSTYQGLEFSSVLQEKKELLNLVIDSCEKKAYPKVLQTATEILNRNDKRLLVCELVLEPSFKEALAGVFGVVLREEEYR